MAAESGKGADEMSYTLTIEAPEKAAWFEEQRSKMTPAQLGELFVKFLLVQCARKPQVKDDSVSRSSRRHLGISPRVQALCGIAKLPDDFDERAFKSESKR